MLLDEALQLIGNVCSNFQGNLKDHQAIQQALSVIRDRIKADEGAKAEKKEVKADKKKE